MYKSFEYQDEKKNPILDCFMLLTAKMHTDSVKKYDMGILQIKRIEK